MSLHVVDYAKKHPYVVGGGAVAVFVGFWLLFSAGSGSSAGGATVVQTGPSEALQAAQLQASTQLGLAQISAGAAVQQIQAQASGQLALATQGYAYQSQADKLSADIASQNIAGQITAQRDAISGQVAIANLQASTAVTQIQANLAQTLSVVDSQNKANALAASTQQYLGGLQAATTIEQGRNQLAATALLVDSQNQANALQFAATQTQVQGALALNAQNNDLLKFQTQTQADTYLGLAGINSALQTNLANISSNQSINLANIQSNQAISTAGIAAQQAVSIAKIGASAQKSQSLFSTLGSLGSALIGKL